MIQWMQSHTTLLWWLFALSGVMFVGTLAAVPLIVVRIPTDYFSTRRRRSTPWSNRHPVVRGLLHIVKNAVGVVLVLGGVAMLFVPGQGLLTIVIGVMLLDFPGKFKLQRWLVSRPQILKAINWMRQKRGVQPLQMEADPDEAEV